ncbi:MAG: AAA family ATPase [Acidobacteriia bacterium]|nr:AAA family ATPase [Terriglobia bacterium]MYG04656.1 AAA family ATPase [Terriglobia bacterium]MYK09723.1 AAA family ATPase [Terriglobia bacterium]
MNYRLKLLPAVALLGPRQVGKTTLARGIADSRESVCLDSENPNHMRKLADPLRYLSAHEKRLVVLDDLQRIPGLFGTLRGIIDEGRRRGSGTGRFLMSGSASAVLLGQSGESLAGRIT